MFAAIVHIWQIRDYKRDEYAIRVGACLAYVAAFFELMIVTVNFGIFDKIVPKALESTRDEKMGLSEYINFFSPIY